MHSVLFLCPDGAARGPMAEALIRHLMPAIETTSASWMPGHVRRPARKALARIGIDTRGLRARGLLEVDFRELDLIVLLSDEGGCPRLPSTVPRVRLALPDPDAAPEDELEEAYRDTLDALERLLPPLLDKHLPR
jgi:protein-tyrosine-phosphatase